jgi:colicin import membrane protein
MSDVTAEVLHGEIMPIEPGTDIIEAVSAQPGIVLLDNVKFDEFYERLKAKAPSDVDASTGAGRDKLRSFAAEVRREKAAIDKARLNLTAGWRDMTKQANEAGKVINERLEQLAIDVRKPLTEWEEAEKAREAEVDRIITALRSARFVAMGESSEAIRDRGTAAHEVKITREQFQDRFEEAEREKKDTVEHLFGALKAAEKAEADRAELERLQAEAAERERADQAKREAEEAEARRVEEERLAEERRVAAEEAEKERIAAAAREAEERTRREAEEAAEEERQRVQREHDEALAAERARAEEAERAAQAERDRISAEEQARKDAEAREAEEKAKREANQAHRTRIKTAAKTAIMTCGADEETAQKIVLAIIAGEIPAVTLAF